MKIKITENQLKTIVENIEKETINEGLFDFLKNVGQKIKDLIQKFKDGDLSKSDFKTELESIRKQEGSSEIPKGIGYNFNSSNGFKSKSRPSHQGIDYKSSRGDKIVLKKGVIFLSKTKYLIFELSCKLRNKFLNTFSFENVSLILILHLFSTHAHILPELHIFSSFNCPHGFLIFDKNSIGLSVLKKYVISLYHEYKRCSNFVDLFSIKTFLNSG